MQSGRDIYDGKLSDDVSWLLVATPTLVDPSRAPEGHHTVKFLTHTVYDLPETGPSGWASYKEEFANKLIEKIQRFCPTFADEVILNRLTKSPVDIEKWNPHMINGSPARWRSIYNILWRTETCPGGHNIECQFLDYGKREAQLTLGFNYWLSWKKCRKGYSFRPWNRSIKSYVLKLHIFC